MSGDILQIKNLTISFHHNGKLMPVVEHLNFSIQAGECLGLAGESGSGKSLTALSILQLLPAGAYVDIDSQIIFDGKDLLQLSEQRMRRVRGKKISLIFQDALTALNPVFTIGQQMMEVYYAHHLIEQNNYLVEAEKLLREVGIDDPNRILNSYPHQLSGGMRQRALIAMSLIGRPDILIADEPTSALDVTIQAQILQLLQELKQQRQMSILLISHDLSVLAQVADEILVMRKGHFIEKNKVNLFYHQPQTNYGKQLIQAIPTLTIYNDQPLKNLTKILSVQNLKIYYPIQAGIFKRTIGYIKAVDDVSFDIHRGETLALVGESGCGKTTTGWTIAKLISMTSGKIEFLQQPIQHLNRKQVFQLRRDIQIIFQDPYASLDPRRMIADSIMEGLLTQKLVTHTSEALKRVDELLISVGLNPQMKWRYPHQFSGGERQRICIARALALQPKLIILDEPTSALDVTIQKQILELLENLQQKMQISFLLITHNFGVVARLAHRIAVMQQGKLIEIGTCREVLRHPRETYTQKLIRSTPSIPTSVIRNGVPQ